VVGVEDWIRILRGFVAVALALSRTWTVKLDVPDVVGVPPIAPEPGLSVSPEGRLPVVIDHVYGLVPPVAWRVVLGYWTPAVPLGRLGVVMDKAGGAFPTVIPIRALGLGSAYPPFRRYLNS